ncbi:MAG: dihydroneopterin aldolase [Halioglobus sp.]
MDSVYIQGLSVDTIIGVNDWERKNRQTIFIDVEMHTEADKAAVSDWIGYAVDYSAVSERIIEFTEASQYKLIETLAEQLARIIMREFGVVWVQLRISKPGAVAQAKDVGVVIERGELP